MRSGTSYDSFRAFRGAPARPPTCWNRLRRVVLQRARTYCFVFLRGGGGFQSTVHQSVREGEG